MSIVDILKEVWVASSRLWSRVIQKSNHETYDLTALSSKGLLIFPGRLDSRSCKLLRDEIDEKLSSTTAITWRDELRSDERIYGFETISKHLEKLINVESLREVGEQYLGRKIDSYFVMAARLSSVDGNIGSGGGWHRDSPFTHQFKAIYYLSPVKNTNGPFLYIEGSHTSSFKIKLMTKFPLRKMRFSNFERESIKAGETQCVADEGALIFADTRGIHRGAPITEGKRYALFYYFYENEIPSHFHELLQK